MILLDEASLLPFDRPGLAQSRRQVEARSGDLENEGQ